MEGSASQAGFFYQNNIAALKLLDCLFFNTDISHVALENYDKGKHIDDVIIYRSDKTDYFQIKWSEDEDNNYTLYSLLNALPDKKSLFRQLAEGYLSVKDAGRDFEIILFTTKRLSNAKRPSAGLTIGLQDFINEIAAPLKKAAATRDTFVPYAANLPVIAIVQAATGLSDEDFWLFLSRLTFQFSMESKEEAQTAIKNKLAHLGIEASLYATLITAVVEWSISGERISKDTVLAALGLSSRFEDKLSQYFKIVDDEYYVPNTSLNNALTHSLEQLKGGYIFIEGPPGIGKSTALTKYREVNKHIVFSYYCFLPDTGSDFGQLRHKAEYFLKSMCIAIEKEFAAAVDLPMKYSGNYEEKLSLYLTSLGKLKKKIIFVIDGLDHVHRDLAFEGNSLLRYIKGTLPEGIYFLLSGQYRQVLAPDVCRQIHQEPLRQIMVSGFDQSGIAAYLDSKGIIIGDLIDRIERVSGGIPVYLHYITELLIEKNVKAYEAILEGLPALIDGKINTYHEYLFQQLANDETSQMILAVLAHRKEQSDVTVIGEILKLLNFEAPESAIHQSIVKYKHLLRQHDAQGFTVFHNSFREFIISKTRIRKHTFDQALSAYYRQNPHSDEAYRNYFRHLFDLGDFVSIIETTTLEWVKEAWRNYRTIDEIKNNVELAWKACAVQRSLSSFIRIAYLKAQLARLDWTMTQGTDISFPTLFLKAGLTANSLRAVWDGDFVTVPKAYFAYYLERYLHVTGEMLPQQVIRQGLSKELQDADFNDLANIYRAQALTGRPIIDIFKDIDQTRWHKKNQQERDLIKARTDLKLSKQQNAKLIDQVFDCLRYHKKYQVVAEIANASTSSAEIRSKAQACLIEIFLSIDKATALPVISELDTNKLPDKAYDRLVTFAAAYLTTEEFVNSFSARPLPPVELHETVVDKNGGIGYPIRKQIIRFPEQLKLNWLWKPETLNSIRLRISALPSPASNFYNSAYELALLWHKNRTAEIGPGEAIQLIKSAIKYLCVPNGIIQVRRQNRDDLLFESTFISADIHQLYENVFEAAVRHLNPNEVREALAYWLNLERSPDGYQNYQVGLGIVKVITGTRKYKMDDLLLEVLKHAEDIARKEEETSTLTNYLAQVAETYGICGFHDHFKRIYDQLIENSFGVASRKDYQFTNILPSLERLHHKDPGQSLQRIKELFELQAQLAEAGNSRMNHINVSELIASFAPAFPKLAFECLAREERNISRSEAMGIVLSPMIEQAQPKDLLLLFAVVKTLPRWEAGAYDNREFIDLSRKLAQKAIESGDDRLAREVLADIRYVLDNELGKPDEYKQFREMLMNLGKDLTDYGIPLPPPQAVIPPALNRLPQDQKFNIQVSIPPPADFVSLFNQDYVEFEARLQNLLDALQKNRRNQTLRNEYYRTAKQVLEKYLESIPTGDKNTIPTAALIRAFLTLKQDIIAIPEEIVTLSTLQACFDRLVKAVERLPGAEKFATYLTSNFNLDQWTKSMLGFFNDHREFVFSPVMTTETVEMITKQGSMLRADHLISFLHKWTMGGTKAKGMLDIAARLAKIDIEKSKAILDQIDVSRYDHPLFRQSYETGTDHELIKVLLEADPDYGQKFLLESFILLKGGTEIIYNLDMLLDYADHFAEPDVLKTDYEANLLYNKELAKGLPAKNTDYQYITEHAEDLGFDQIVINYLLSLFSYPVAAVRQLTLQSLFDLVAKDARYLDLVDLAALDSNQIEHVLTVLNAIALKWPEKLYDRKDALWPLTGKEHFNIAAAVSELLLRLNSCRDGFLSAGELAKIKLLNKTSPIILNPVMITPLQAPRFLFSYDLYLTVENIGRHDNGEFTFDDEVYTDVSAVKQLGGYTIKDSAALHRYYNLNANYDTIEITTPYDDEVRDSINKVFYRKVKQGAFDDELIAELGRQLRRYDPAKLFFRPVSQPAYANWLPKNDSETDFLSFKDLSGWVNDYIDREPDQVTLFEAGDQRPASDYPKSHFTVKFRVFAFLMQNGLPLKQQVEKLSRLEPAIFRSNDFLYEMPALSSKSADFPMKGVCPVLAISQRLFRHAEDLQNVFLLPDIAQKFGVSATSQDIVTSLQQGPLSTIYWQGHYASGVNRRRFKPMSAGLTVKISKAALSAFLKENDLKLCYDVKLERSTDKYKPGAEMDWSEKRFLAEAKL